MKITKKYQQQSEISKHGQSTQNHFYYLISEIRFFKIQSIIITILIFFAWNLPLLRILQMFVNNNPNITDRYFLMMFNVSKFLFSIEQFVTLDFIDRNYQNCNVLNLIFFIILVLYGFYVLYLYRLCSKNQKMGIILLTIFRCFTFFIYFLCFYIYIVCWTALVKGIRAGSYKYLPFAVFNILVTFMIIYVIEFYSNEIQYISNMSLAKLNYQSNTSIFLAKLLLAGCIAFKDYFAVKNNFVCLYLIVALIIIFFQFRNILDNISYLNEYTQTIRQVFTLIAFITYLSIVIFYLNRDYGILNNTLYLMITVGVLGLRCLFLYKKKRRQNLFQGEMSDTYDETELIWRMIEYIKLLKNQFNQRFSFKALSIIRHVQQCNKPQCFCRGYSEKNGTQLINNKDFMMKYISSKLEELRDRNSKSFYMKLVVINFKLIFEQSFTEIYHEFQAINTIAVNMNESLKGYVIYQFKREFSGRIKQQTKESNRLKLQQLFMEQQFRDELTEELRGYNSKNVKKYTLLSQDFCILNHVYQICNDITGLIKRIQTKWSFFKRINTNNLRILQIFLIYFEFILPIRIQTSEVKAIINKRLNSFRFLKGTDEVTINKAIYTQKAAVLQTAFHNYDNIRILNISPNCPKLLHLDSKQIIDKQIHEIIPMYLCYPHKQLVSERLKVVASLKHLQIIRDTYFVDHNNHCFSGKVHVKIASIGHQIIFYVLIIKEDDNNYIILDNNMIIQGIGKRVQKQQIFYKENCQTNFSLYCKEDIRNLLESKTIIKKTIQISQLTKTVDTKSLIKGNNLQDLDEEQLRNMFDTISYECEVQMQKQYIKNTPYYTMKLGEMRKALKIADGKSTLQQLKKVNKKIGTVIMTANQTKKLDSLALLTQVQIENKSEDFLKTGKQGQDRLAMNETSSTASSIKENNTLSYTQLMMKLKTYLIDPSQTPRFSIPIMKIYMILWGCLLITCGFIETYVIKTALFSLSQTYEASNLVNNINQVMEISLNNQKAMQIYCPNPLYTNRCNYLNSTQSFLNKQLYTEMLDSFTSLLTKKTDMFGMRYYQQLNQVVTVQFNDDFVDITHQEFLEIFYYSLLQVQSLDFRGQTAQKYQFLNGNWQLLKQINGKAIIFYNQYANAAESSLISIIYSYSILMLVVILGFALPFHIFLKKCDDKKETIVRLHELIDILSCKQLMDNQKAITPIINEGYAQKSFTPDAPLKIMTKRYSQFTYRRHHKQAILVVIGFFVVILLNIAFLISTLQYLPTNSQMSNQLQLLVTSQNNAIQDYMTLKMDVMMTSTLVQTRAGSSVQFVERLKHIYASFALNDNTLQNNLKNLTISDLCIINTGFLWATQLKQCQNNNNYQTMKKGLAAATESLVRQTEITSIDFDSNLTDRSAILGSKRFRGLDDQMFFNMRAFQLVKAELISSLVRTTNTFSSTLLFLNYLQMVVVGACIYLSILFLSQKTIILKNLLGIVLQIPQRIFSESKVVMRIVTDTLLQQ